MQVGGGGLLLFTVPLGNEQDQLVFGKSRLDRRKGRGPPHEQRDDNVGENDDITKRKNRDPVRCRDALVVPLKGLRQGFAWWREGALTAAGTVTATEHEVR